MEDLVLRPLADAFLQVGVPVALLAAAAAWARVRYGSRALDVLVRHPRLAIVIAAALGVSPGCGGAILVAALYLRGRASYGAMVAALTATMGDASFVMIALDPALALAIHAILLVVGIATGYAVDAAKVDPRRGRLPSPAEPVTAGGGGGSAPVPQAAMARVATAAPRSALLDLAPAPAALWLTAALGSLLALPVSFQLLDSATLAPAFGGVDPWLLLGVAGALACLVVFVRSGCRFSDDVEEPHPTLAQALTHGAVETAFVVVWVSVAFLAQALLVAFTPLSASSVVLTGAVGVLIAVAVALIPGCGTQIAFTGLYATGALPFPALLANAVAQDGDALLPVLAHDRRTAVVTTAITSVPAVLAGFAFLLL